MDTPFASSLRPPDPLDLALLEDRVADAAISAAGWATTGVRHPRQGRPSRIVAGISGIIWGGCCAVHALWVDRPSGDAGWPSTDDPEDEARRRGCTHCCPRLRPADAASTSTSATRQPASSRAGRPAHPRWFRKSLSPAGPPAGAASPDLTRRRKGDDLVHVVEPFRPMFHDQATGEDSAVPTAVEEPKTLSASLVGVALRLLGVVRLEVRPRQRHAEVAAPRLVLAHEDEPGRHRHHLVPVRDEVRAADPRPAGLLAQLL